jgi:hypothetical protein
MPQAWHVRQETKIIAPERRRLELQQRTLDRLDKADAREAERHQAQMDEAAFQKGERDRIRAARGG